MHELIAETWLPRPREEVFDFFRRAENLEELTPPLVRFRILSAPTDMRVGATIDYRLRIHGLPMRWQSEITVWEPPHRFVDEQRRGPYRLWHHEHTFEERDGGTLVRDHVRYAVPGGPLAPLLHALLVGRDVRRIFAFREERMRARFGGGPTGERRERA